MRLVLGAIVALASGALAGEARQPLAQEMGSAGAGIPVSFDGVRMAQMELARAATVNDFPLSDGRRVTLILERFDVLAPDARVVHVNDDGVEANVTRPSVRMWRGAVDGEAGSSAFLAFSDLLGTNGYVRSQGKVFILSSGAVGVPQCVIQELDKFPAAAAGDMAICGGGLLPPGIAQLPPHRGGEVDRGAWVCKRFTVAVECDTEFTSDNFSGNSAAAQAYATLLMGAVSSIYQTDMDIRLDVSFLRTWGANDPYNSGDMCSQLGQFQDYWNANQAATPRHTAHLMSGRSLGGGCAYLASLCDPNAYGVSANMRGSFPYPLQNNVNSNWDVIVVAHEIGHNFGTGHTHDSYVPPIDGCGNNDCTLAAQGTIMSYCHLCSGGISNIALTFGPRVEAVIREFVDGPAGGCGSLLPAFTQQPAPASTPEGDPITLTTAAVSIDAGTYQWKRNGVAVANNARISGATTTTLSFVPAVAADQGTYSVTYTSPDCGAITSSNAALTVVAACIGGAVPPSITLQPSPTSVNRGLAAHFSVSATGAGPITYQWRKGTTLLANSGRISGADTAMLTISNAQTSDTGLYNVIVNGPQCRANSVYASLDVIATPAQFALLSPPDGATGVPRDPLFGWDAADDAASYIIAVDDQANFSSPLINTPVNRNSLFTLPNTLVNGVTYFWKVVAVNPHGQSTSIPASASFTVAIPPPPACAGDANRDGVVNGADLSVMLGQFGGPATPEFGADFNGDGIVDGADLSVLLGRFGVGC